MKNHSDELIFHSQGLRRSAANLVIASENSPSRNSPRVSSRKALRHEGKGDIYGTLVQTVWSAIFWLLGAGTCLLCRAGNSLYADAAVSFADESDHEHGGDVSGAEYM